MLILFGILVAALVVSSGLVGAFVWWRRRRGSVLFARSPLLELPLRERGPPVRTLRRGDPIPADQRDVALRVARDMVARRGLPWIYFAVALLQGTNAVRQDDGAWRRWFYAVVVVGAVVYQTWLAGRMRRAETRLTDDHEAP